MAEEPNPDAMTADQQAEHDKRAKAAEPVNKKILAEKDLRPGVEPPAEPTKKGK